MDLDLTAAGLRLTPELGHRGRVLHIDRFHVLDDCYNASPVAMSAALDALVELSGALPRVALLGQMRELGPQSASLHREVGKKAAASDLALLITVGAEAAEIARGALDHGMEASRVIAAPDIADAVAALEEHAKGECWVLVKASRGVQLERAIERLTRTQNQEHREKGRSTSVA